jgi:uncharacterized membrane protein YfhO
MQDSNFNPNQIVVIHGGEDLLSHPAESTITAYSAEEVIIQVEAESDTYLLLADAYYPGWQATIDGDPTSIYRADIMFRAVRVPAGSHEVVFSYRPAWLPGILWGGVLSWGMVAVWLGYVGWRTRRAVFLRNI